MMLFTAWILALNFEGTSTSTFFGASTGPVIFKTLEACKSEAAAVRSYIGTKAECVEIRLTKEANQVIAR